MADLSCFHNGVARLLMAIVLTVSPGVWAATAEPPKTFFENPVPPGSYSDEKPDFLFFKNITITRKEKQELHFDITLCGKLAAKRDNKVIFYFGFDIDADPSTGSKSLTIPDFGQDIGIWFVKEKGLNRFVESAGSVVTRGKTLTFKISQTKVSGDKIEFDVRSELFGIFPQFRMFVQSEQDFYKRELKTNSVDVDQIPRKGVLLVSSPGT